MAARESAKEEDKRSHLFGRTDLYLYSFKLQMDYFFLHGPATYFVDNLCETWYMARPGVYLDRS